MTTFLTVPLLASIHHSSAKTSCRSPVILMGISIRPRCLAPLAKKCPCQAVNVAPLGCKFGTPLEELPAMHMELPEIPRQHGCNSWKGLASCSKTLCASLCCKLMALKKIESGKYSWRLECIVCCMLSFLVVDPPHPLQLNTATSLGRRACCQLANAILVSNGRTPTRSPQHPSSACAKSKC